MCAFTYFYYLYGKNRNSSGQGGKGEREIVRIPRREFLRTDAKKICNNNNNNVGDRQCWGAKGRQKGSPYTLVDVVLIDPRFLPLIARITPRGTHPRRGQGISHERIHMEASAVLLQDTLHRGYGVHENQGRLLEPPGFGKKFFFFLTSLLTERHCSAAATC